MLRYKKILRIFFFNYGVFLGRVRTLDFPLHKLKLLPFNKILWFFNDNIGNVESLHMS